MRSKLQLLALPGKWLSRFYIRQAGHRWLNGNLSVAAFGAQHIITYGMSLLQAIALAATEPDAQLQLAHEEQIWNRQSCGQVLTAELLESRPATLTRTACVNNIVRMQLFLGGFRTGHAMQGLHSHQLV